MNKSWSILAAAVLAMGTFALAGCDRDNKTPSSNDGTNTGSKTGGAVDRAMDKAGNAVDKGMDKAGDAVDKGMDKTGDAARKAGEKIDKGVNTATTRATDLTK
jgi:hypothetical protein